MEFRCFARLSSSVSGTFPKSPSVVRPSNFEIASEYVEQGCGVPCQAASSSSLEAMTKLKAEEEEEEEEEENEILVEGLTLCSRQMIPFVD